MFDYKHALVTWLTSVLTVLSLSFPALAQEMWQGEGQIISGEGEGTLVRLEALVKDEQITFLSGISQGEQIELAYTNPLKDTVKTDVGIWRFFRWDDEFHISFLQNTPKRQIVYLLFPMSEHSQNEFQ